MTRVPPTEACVENPYPFKEKRNSGLKHNSNHCQTISRDGLFRDGTLHIPRQRQNSYFIVYIHTVKASLPVLEQLIILHLAHIVSCWLSHHCIPHSFKYQWNEILMQGCPTAIWAIPTHCRAIPQEDMQTYILHTMGLQFILADSNPEQIFISLQWVMLRVAKPIDIKWPGK